MKHVWKGHGADSEIGNVSARQAALNRWTATDKRWKRKAVSRGSVVTSVKRLPICVRKRFLEGQSSPQSNAFRFASGTPELWNSRGQEFPGPLERNRGSGRASFIYLGNLARRTHMNTNHAYTHAHTHTHTHNETKSRKHNEERRVKHLLKKVSNLLFLTFKML